MPGPPGAVRFCMGLGRPGHRSAERAAATVGAPRRENNEKLPGERQPTPPPRVTPDSLALRSPQRFSGVFSHAMFASDGELGRGWMSSHLRRLKRLCSALLGSFLRSFLRRREQLSFLRRSGADTAGSSPAPRRLTAAPANQSAPGEGQTGN